MLFIFVVLMIDNRPSGPEAPERFDLQRAVANYDIRGRRDGVNAFIRSEMRSGKQSEPSGEVFPIERESPPGKQHDGIEDTAPLGVCLVDGIEKRARS